MPSLLWVNHFAVTTSQGGGTRHFELGRELVKRGWDVTIAASDFDLQTRRYTRRANAAERAPVDEMMDGVRLRWLWARPYQRNDWRRAVNWLSFAHELWRTNDWKRADIVIGSSPHLFGALAAQRVARRWGVPFILEVRDLWPESMLAAGARAGTVYQVFARIAAHLYATADHIVVLARGSADYLVKRGVARERIAYLPNGVDATAFSVERVPRPTLTLIYTGSHGPANGLHAILDAAELLREQTHIRWILIGDGPVKAELRAEAKRRGLDAVEFRDPIPKNEIPALLAEADVGLMVLRDTPLFSFGVSPNKLFDYMGASMPVVCNVPGDVAEMLRSAGAGEQAADASGAALADAVLRLAERPPESRCAMGHAGRTWVTREHDRPVLAARLDALLRSVQEAHAPA